MPSDTNSPAAHERRARSQLEIWLEEARNGSTAALGSLLDACRRYLLLVANRDLDSDLRPKAAASDLVQDTLIAAERNIVRFEGSTEEELFAWLSAILKNRLANNVRRHRHTHKRSVNREVPLETVPEALLAKLCDVETPSQAAIDRDEERRLQVAMARLPEHLRQVLVLRNWERQPFASIGNRIDRTADGARKLWVEAVRRLQLELRNTS